MALATGAQGARGVESPGHPEEDSPYPTDQRKSTVTGPAWLPDLPVYKQLDWITLQLVQTRVDLLVYLIGCMHHFGMRGLSFLDRKTDQTRVTC